MIERMGKRKKKTIKNPSRRIAFSQKDIRSTLGEVNALLDAYWHSSDFGRARTLMLWANELLKPLVDAGEPRATWLYSCLAPVWGDKLSQKGMDAKYWKLVREAADKGLAEAQYHLACELDYNNKTKKESAYYFRLAAAQGHPHAMWCHGLNLLFGECNKKDEKQGLRLIKKAAEKDCHFAMEFIKDAYAMGIYGFRKNEAKAALWKKKAMNAFLKY